MKYKMYSHNSYNLYVRILTVFFVIGFYLSAPAQVTDLAGWDICLDPGHSRTENMGIYGYSEAERNVRVALRLSEMLLNETDIDTVYLTRTNDQQLVSLSQRSGFANAIGATWFHSIHSDAASGPGANSTLLLWGQYSNGQEKIPNGGKAMADIMVVNLSAGMRIPTRGSIGDCSFYGCTFFGPYLHVNRETTMASELSESGFHTNPVQNQLFMNADWKRFEARMFFWSILDYHQIQRPLARILTGIVRDFDNHIPINGAEINVEDRVYTTDTYESLFYQYSSDPDQLHNGFYYFEDLNQDTALVIVSAENYYSDTSKVRMVDDFFTFKDIELISTIHPYIVTSSPQQGDTAFSILDDIIIRFSRPMDRASVEDNLIISPEIPYTVSWWDGDHELHIRSDSLRFEIDYSLTISGQSEDLHQHPFDGNADGVGGDDYTLLFRTASDYYAPELLQAFPATNASDVELQPIVSLTFDEQVDSNSVNTDIIFLERFSDKSTVAGELAHYVLQKRSIFNFFPDDDLHADEVYVTRVYPGVSDLLGNETQTLKSFPFKTGTTELLITTIDDFESGVANWWQPNGSGSTTGYLDGIYRDSDTSFVNLLTDSRQSMELYYYWDLNADAWLIREYLSTGAPRDVEFGLDGFIQIYIFGDASGNRFRFALDEGDASAWTGHEVSKWITIDWFGWKRIEWDLSDPQSTGQWIGNGVLDGTRYRFDSIQLTYTPDANSKGSLYFDDLSFVQKSTITSIEEIEAIKPVEYQLFQNYPNPFNPTTEIRFVLPTGGRSKLTVYNMLGQEVARLIDTDLTAGKYAVHFNAGHLSSGTYIYVLQSGSVRLKQKMILIK